MAGQGKRGWSIAFQCVAAVAGIEVGCVCELPLMPIAVTVGALLEFDFEKRVSPLGNVTLFALHFRMFCL